MMEKSFGYPEKVSVGEKIYANGFKADPKLKATFVQVLYYYTKEDYELVQDIREIDVCKDRKTKGLAKYCALVLLKDVPQNTSRIEICVGVQDKWGQEDRTFTVFNEKV